VSLQEMVHPWVLAASDMDLLELSEGMMTKMVAVFSYIGFSYFSISFLISRNTRSCSDRQAGKGQG